MRNESYAGAGLSSLLLDDTASSNEFLPVTLLALRVVSHIQIFGQLVSLTTSETYRS